MIMNSVLAVQGFSCATTAKYFGFGFSSSARVLSTGRRCCHQSGTIGGCPYYCCRLNDHLISSCLAVGEFCLYWKSYRHSRRSGRHAANLPVINTVSAVSSARGITSSSSCYSNRSNSKNRRRNRLLRYSSASAAATAESSSPSPNDDHRKDQEPGKPKIRRTQSSPSHYHPSEELAENETLVRRQVASLTEAEIARTIVEINSKATLVFSGVIEDEIHENIIWPELSYLTDEHGDIYIKVRSKEDILQNQTLKDDFVQILIGLDNMKSIDEVEFSDSSDFHFSVEEISNEDYDSYDDFEPDIALSTEDDEDDMDSELFGDWGNMDTMRASHPMHFARKIAEVVSDAKCEYMDTPSTGLVIQGFMRPVFPGENPTVQEKDLDFDNERLSEKTTNNGDESESLLQSGMISYKLEMISIQLVLAYGNLSLVKVQDYRESEADVIAQSKDKIISQLKSSGEKTTEALKSICWRIKNIQVEEVDLTGVDSLGFDLRVCSGTQIQNLRFAFKTRATSEYNAQMQLHDLLFPRIEQNQQERHQAHRKES